MKALLYSAWDTLEMAELPEPIAAEGEVRIRVQAAGICGSELEAVRGHSPRRTPPLILGHEFTGIIDQLGEGVRFWQVGDTVVANAVISDGTCPACLRGQTHLCANRQLFGMHRPGAFAEYVTVPTSVLIPRPAGLAPEIAALTEPLGNGVHVAGLLETAAPKSVVVFGAGPIGLLAMQAIHIRYGSDIAVVDRIPERLEVARRLGASIVLTLDQLEELDSWAGVKGIDAAVDAVGASATKRASLAVTRSGGTTVWIGLHENETKIATYDIILAEKKLLGSYSCSQQELETALSWLANGKVEAKSWTSLFPLEEADIAFKTMLKPGPHDVKGVIVTGS